MPVATEPLPGETWQDLVTRLYGPGHKILTVELAAQLINEHRGAATANATAPVVLVPTLGIEDRSYDTRDFSRYSDVQFMTFFKGKDPDLGLWTMEHPGNTWTWSSGAKLMVCFGTKVNFVTLRSLNYYRGPRGNYFALDRDEYMPVVVRQPFAREWSLYRLGLEYTLYKQVPLIGEYAGVEPTRSLEALRRGLVSRIRAAIETEGAEYHNVHDRFWAAMRGQTDYGSALMVAMRFMVTGPRGPNGPRTIVVNLEQAFKVVSVQICADGEEADGYAGAGAASSSAIAGPLGPAAQDELTRRVTAKLDAVFNEAAKQWAIIKESKAIASALLPLAQAMRALSVADVASAAGQSSSSAQSAQRAQRARIEPELQPTALAALVRHYSGTDAETAGAAIAALKARYDAAWRYFE